jgi:hypothetical protein
MPVLMRGLRRHWLFTLFLLGGAVFRLLVQLAYHPALLYFDSFRYLNDLGAFFPDGVEPVGYEILLLGPALAVGNLGFVVLVQHLLGLALGVGIYALLCRVGARRWVAALAAVPVLLDAYQLQIEHNIMSDLLFQVLLLAVVLVLTWRGAPGPVVAMTAGAVLAVAVMVRVVGVTLVVPAALFVLLAAGRHPWDGWRRRLLATGTFVAGFAAFLGCYGLYHADWTGTFGIGGSNGSVVYGRTAVVADCAHLNLTRQERLVCPRDPRPVRQANGIDFYVNYFHNPGFIATLPPGMDVEAVQRSFATQVFLQQPWDVISGVLTDFGKGFAFVRTQAPGDVPLDRWQFQTTYPLYAPQWYVAEWSQLYDNGTLSVDAPLAGFLRAYQLGGGYTPGVVLGLAGLIGIAAVLGIGRARHSGLRAMCLLTAGMGGGVLFTAAAMEFSWRYQLPGLVLLPLAGALGITAITGRRPDYLAGAPGTRRLTRTASPEVDKENRMPAAFLRAADEPDDADRVEVDEVDQAALADFQARYGDRQFAPVVVLIAAYNEQDSIGTVLATSPEISCGHPVDVLVVVDGATDATADIALSHGAFTCIAPTNRGQGAALRLGYRLAALRGARYIITTDADGQYDMSELPLLLRPLVEDRADFVTGSRRLGRLESTDLLRRAGTYAFAWLVSVLTRQRVTDTSFGFRGMKAEVPNSVQLEQPQYQSSELLVAVLSRGYRVLEQPMTMLARAAGRSKKGNNLWYGFHYAKVVLGTWRRERHRKPMVVGPLPVSFQPGEPLRAGERT